MLNLSDVRGAAAITASPGARDNFYYLIQPRTVLLSLGVRF